MVNKHSRAIPAVRVARPAGGFLARRDGAAAVEFALVAIPFLAIVIAIMQTAIVFFAGQVLETATETAGRQLLTGAVQTANMTQSQYKNLVCASLPGLLSCNGIMVDVRATSSFSSADMSYPALTFSGGAVTTPMQFQPGNPGDIVTLKVMYLWPVVGGPLSLNAANQTNGQLLLVASAVFRNEQYK